MSEAVHMMISTARHASLLPASTPALRRAADRWQELWEALTGQLDEEQLRMRGLSRHAGEWCWLAKALLEHCAAGKEQQSPYFQRLGHESSRELYELLRELRGGS
jgi:hypothetical protein